MDARDRAGDRVSPGAGADAGPHRRARDRRPRGDARRHGGPRRRPRQDQPALAGRSGDRPFGHGRRVRAGGRVRGQRQAGVRAQPGAVRVPALGTDDVSELPRRAARHRDLPPGQPRVPRPGRVDRRRGRPDGRLSGHPRRDGQPHDHGQRAGRARLGRRRDRGGGRDARPADLDAGARCRRGQADRDAPGGHDGDRPRPDRHAAAAPPRRGEQVRRVLRSGRRRAARRGSGDDRQHVAGVRRHLRAVPDRRRDAALSRASRAATRRASRWSRPTRRPRGSGTTRPTPAPVFTETLELDLGTVQPSLAGPKRPQDRVPLDGRRGRRSAGPSPSHARTARRDRSRSTAAPTTSPTATSSSPRSPAARTPRTPP